MYTKEQVKTAKALAESFGVTKLGSVGTNTKLKKSDKGGVYLTYGLSLSPSNTAGDKYNTCPMASPGCRKACLNTAGFGVYSSVQEARIKKTKFWFDHRDEFKILLWNELKNHIAHCKKCSGPAKCCIRYYLGKDVSRNI
jgi:hypothetical protein